MAAPMKFLMKCDIFLLKIAFGKWEWLNSFNPHFQWLPAKSDPRSQLDSPVRQVYLSPPCAFNRYVTLLIACTEFRIVKSSFPKVPHKHGILQS